MSKYNLIPGEIRPGVLYLVAGAQSVSYNGATYNTGSTFRGVAGVAAFTYSGSGTQEVNQVTEGQGWGVEFLQSDVDLPGGTFPEVTSITGFAIEYAQNAEDIGVLDVTTIQGFSMEFLDYPIYAFQITTRRL